jgi:hypothetical protein
MKAAICISGELRTFDTPCVVESFKETTKNLDCDIFVSSWLHRGFSLNGKKGDVLSTTHASDLSEEIVRLYKPKSFKLENYNEWISGLSDPIANLMKTRLIGGENTTSPPQLYKIYDCNELVKKSGENYDVVIRCRPDCLYLHKLRSLLDVDMSKIYHINCGIHGAYWPKRVFDIFFYSSQKNMDILSDTWLSLLDNVNYSFDNGLDLRDCCRLLYVTCLKNNLDVVDLEKRVCGVYRGGDVGGFMEEMKKLGGQT